MTDVYAEQFVTAPPANVAATMLCAGSDAAWVGGVREARLVTPEPFGVGSRVERRGGFMGRRFSWVTETVAYDAESLLDMKFVAGPFKGGVTYALAPVEGGSVASIRIDGVAGFFAPFMAAMMRRSIRSDLRRLKALVEAKAA